MAEMETKKKTFGKERDDLQELLDSAVTEKNMAMQEVATQSEELGLINAQKDSTDERKRQQEKELHEMWSNCVKEVNKIMYDGVCGILNVRKNVVDAAATALVLLHNLHFIKDIEFRAVRCREAYLALF
jgi:hypothetical protein